MKIIRHRERHEDISYSLHFDSRTTPGWGFGFDCDAQGNVDLTKLTPLQLSSWQTANNTADFHPGEVQKCYHRWTEPTVGLCSCGTEVVLDSFTNTCPKCHSDYNMSGQRLAPRSQWGEETGESLSDILSIP